MKLWSIGENSAFKSKLLSKSNDNAQSLLESEFCFLILGSCVVSWYTEFKREVFICFVWLNWPFFFVHFYKVLIKLSTGKFLSIKRKFLMLVWKRTASYWVLKLPFLLLVSLILSIKLDCILFIVKYQIQNILVLLLLLQG